MEKEQSAKAAKNAKEEKVRSTDFFVILTVAGFILGVVFGFVLKSIPLCIVGGTVVGAAVGIILDNNKDKNRENKHEKEERNV